MKKRFWSAMTDLMWIGYRLTGNDENGWFGRAYVNVWDKWVAATREGTKR